MLKAQSAAMLLSFDISTDAIAEHDDWHSHEHMPERLAIPGFTHGSRWIASAGSPRYFVMYEVQSLAVLASPAYLERLNNPSPWTTKIMRSYIGMRRALCEVEASFGHGLGGTALLLQFSPAEGADQPLRDWLKREILAKLVRQRGIVSARFFAASLAAKMTREQQIRGADASFRYAVWVTG